MPGALAEQPRILQNNAGLVGQRLREANLVGAEQGARLIVKPHDSPDDLAAGNQRQSDQRVQILGSKECLVGVVVRRVAIDDHRLVAAPQAVDVELAQRAGRPAGQGNGLRRGDGVLRRKLKTGRVARQ